MIEKNKKIAVVGAGLVGALWACYLAKKGYYVHIFERRPDLRKEHIDGGRSINLAISDRGWNALEKIGMKEQLKKIAIPMYGRVIHQKDKSTDFQPYGIDNQAIYSISRDELNKALINKADENDHIFFHFNQKCVDLDFDKSIVYFKGKQEMENSSMQCDAVFGTDGAFSNVRYEMQKTPLFDFSQYYLKHAYKELSILPNKDGSHRIEKNALHIWPRKRFMLIALPNLDGSFTVTLFLQYKGEKSFEALCNDSKIEAFFKEEFPTAYQLMPQLIQDFHENPTSSLVTIKSDPWCYNKVCLLGDAAHAVVPFYGQGMNAGFEDCFILDAVLEGQKVEDWTQCFKTFSKKHVKNGQAIADLAMQHFIEMRDATSDDRFLMRKKLERFLMEKFPEKYLSQYQMVTFSHIPYSKALTKGNEQTNFAEQLLENYPNENQWNSVAFNEDVLQWFKTQNS